MSKHKQTYLKKGFEFREGGIPSISRNCKPHVTEMTDWLILYVSWFQHNKDLPTVRHLYRVNFKRNGKTIDASGKIIYAQYECEYEY